MTNEHHNEPYTNEDHQVLRALDALGESNRSAPDDGFEHRLMDALTPALAPIPIPIESAPKPFSWIPVAAVAACMVLVTAAAVIFAPTSAQTGQPNANQTLVALEEDLSAFEELASLSDSLDLSIAELDFLTETMDTELTHPSVFVEFNANPSTSGSL